MYEGAPDYPGKDIWWEIVERYKVTIMYCAPTAIRACMKWGVEHPEAHDLSSLRLLGTVGEPINPKAWLWYWKVIGGGRCPIVDTWWQTETGAIMITTLPALLDTKPGSAGKPLPGIEADVVDEEGEDAGTEQGYLILKRPWPSMLRTLYKEDDRFVETYWDKFGKETYVVGDAARRDEDGYFWIIGRIDDVVNVSGHRLSTAEVESAIVSHPKVAEAAVIGQPDEDTGQAITAFVTLEGDDDEGADELIDEIREQVASRIGKFARPKRIIWAGDLPKTRSGQDHAPPAARHRRGPRARRRHDAARPGRDAEARGQDQGARRRGRGSRLSLWRDRSSRHSHRPIDSRFAGTRCPRAYVLRESGSKEERRDGRLGRHRALGGVPGAGQKRRSFVVPGDDLLSRVLHGVHHRRGLRAGLHGRVGLSG